MDSAKAQSRRLFLRETGIILGTSLVGGRGLAKSESSFERHHRVEEEVSPSEDLMREHGVLKRVLLVYDEAATRLEAGKEVPPETIAGGADIIRTFIEDYHEKLEENYLFPRFEKAHKLLDLVSILRTQHQRGRVLTDLIRRDATLKAMHDLNTRKLLVARIRQFIRMYNPHEAREDTVLFPAFRTIVSANEYNSLGEDFEDKEHQLFGEDGFEKYVERVANLEKSLEINDLSQFTPKVK